MRFSLFAASVIAAGVQAAPSSLEVRAAQSYLPAGPLKADWKTLGCANDLYPNARALNAGYSGSTSGSMTISTCLTYCNSQGTYLAGIEAGYQCFCGPTLDNGSKLTQAAPLSSSSNGGCTAACQGNSGQNCGGDNRLLVFQNTQHGAPKVASISGQSYQGCYADNESNRLLPYVEAGNDASMTPSKCTSACNDMGYDLSGVEYRTQCFCGHSSSVTLGTKLSETRCESSCGGDVTSFCGGAGALTVYKASMTASDPATFTSTNGTKYNLQGCYTDRSDSQGRALSTYNTFDNNSVAKCLNTCQGYTYAGMEYGHECRCGNTLASFSKPGATCNVACNGNSQQLCGGAYALTLYKKA